MGYRYFFISILITIQHHHYEQVSISAHLLTLKILSIAPNYGLFEAYLRPIYGSFTLPLRNVQGPLMH